MVPKAEIKSAQRLKKRFSMLAKLAIVVVRCAWDQQKLSRFLVEPRIGGLFAGVSISCKFVRIGCRSACGAA